MLPLLNGIELIVHGGSQVLDLRMRLQTGEVSPSTSDFHSVLEAHLEDGPIGAIGLQPRDIGWELFDGGRWCGHDNSRGRQGCRWSSWFGGLGRAHNL